MYTGGPRSYSNWYSVEPDNCGLQFYIILHMSNGNLYDTSDRPLSFVCEYIKQKKQDILNLVSVQLELQFLLKCYIRKEFRIMVYKALWNVSINTDMLYKTKRINQ